MTQNLVFLRIRKLKQFSLKMSESRSTNINSTIMEIRSYIITGGLIKLKLIIVIDMCALLIRLRASAKREAHFAKLGNLCASRLIIYIYIYSLPSTITNEPPVIENNRCPRVICLSKMELSRLRRFTSR